MVNYILNYLAFFFHEQKVWITINLLEYMKRAEDYLLTYIFLPYYPTMFFDFN